MSPKERELRIDPRVRAQLTARAIKDSLVRAIVELMTNSDDSYRKLAEKGTPGTGFIKIRIKRKHRNSSMEIIDEAGGLDAVEMDKKIGDYGADTSGFTKGSDVRGYFGRGLKDAILGLGEGRVRSVKGNEYFECSLTHDCIFRLEDPVKLTPREKTELEKQLGIRDHGTVVSILVRNPNVIIPRFDKLAEQISRYYSLRDINGSPKRTVYLCEMNERGTEKDTPVRLTYKVPLGKVITEIDLQIAYKGISIPARLVIQKATDHLDQAGDCREGGLLISSKHAIHDITLFGYDDDPYAASLFGRVKCDYIDTLMKEDDTIVSDRRSGLEWDHLFARSLKTEVTRHVKLIVDTIRKEEENKKRDIENARTRQRFLAAVKTLNEIAAKELGETDKRGEIEGPGEILNAPPPNGFDFIPDFYKVVAGQKATLCLKMTIPWVVMDGSLVKIVADNDDLDIVENGSFVARQSDAAKNGVLTINPRVIGRRVGSEIIVTAITGVQKAEALVKVVSKIERTTAGKEKPRQSKHGLFSDIKYDPNLEPKIRHHYDKETGIIKISSNAPSVKRYLGPNGEGQDEKHCQVLVAELVTDAVCRELARRKADKNKLPYLGEDISSAVNREINRLIFEYAATIHSIIVS